MSVPIYGRVTPIQALMLGLAGEIIHTVGIRHTDESRLEYMRMSKDLLCRLTKTDHGFDLKAWHEYLLDDGVHSQQYCHPYAWAGVREKIVSLLQDEDRCRLVDILIAAGPHS